MNEQIIRRLQAVKRNHQAVSAELRELEALIKEAAGVATKPARKSRSDSERTPPTRRAA